ncbi:MAG: ABC transporter substrate-binding protein [Burkholderiaceae bacterium]
MKPIKSLLAVAAVMAFGSQPVIAEEGKPGGTLVIVGSQAPRHFNAAVQSGVATMVPAAQIFAFLVRADEDWNIKPYLAESWEVAPDGMSVTFKLVKDATFHDGKPITSKDVAFSIKTQKENHPFKTSLGAVDTVETPDAHTAIVKLKTPHPALLVAMSTSILPIIPEHIYGDGQEIKSHPRNTVDVVGSGPFMLKEYKKGEYWILEKNPNYFRKGLPYLDKIVYNIVKDGSSRTISLEKADAHMEVFMSAVSDISRMKKAAHMVTTDDGYEGIGPNNWLAFNTKKPPLDNPKVRQAIAYAIDRNFITKALHRGASKASTGPITPGSPFYTDDVARYDVDLKKSMALLDEAGFKPDADGSRMTLTIDYLPAVVDVQQRVAEYIRPQLKKVGITVEVRNSPDFPTWAKRVSNWEFDMTMDLPFNWGDPVIGVHRTYLCNNIKKGVIWSNTQQYCNPEVDSLLEKAAVELDKTKRRGFYVKAQKILADDLPVYWLNTVPYHTTYNKNLGNPPLTVWGSVAPLDELYWKVQPK